MGQIRSTAMTCNDLSLELIKGTYFWTACCASTCNWRDHGKGHAESLKLRWLSTLSNISGETPSVRYTFSNPKAHFILLHSFLLAAYATVSPFEPFFFSASVNLLVLSTLSLITVTKLSCSFLTNVCVIQSSVHCEPEPEAHHTLGQHGDTQQPEKLEKWSYT